MSNFENNYADLVLACEDFMPEDFNDITVSIDMRKTLSYN